MYKPVFGLVKKELIMKYITLSRCGTIVLLFVSIISLVQIPLKATSAAFPGVDISEKELEQLYNVLQNMSDEELQEIETLSKNMLKDMGYDPETLQPINAVPQPIVPQKEKFAMPAKPEPQITRVEPEPSKITLATVPALLQSLIDQLIQLQTKAATSEQANDRRLQQVLSDLHHLLYDLKVINKPHHHKRLALPEFDKLRNTLSRLDTALTAATSQFTSAQREELWENPYTLLGVDPSATQEEIDKAYESVKEQIGPDAVSARMAKEGRDPQDIKRATKEAELNFEFITEAYEKVKDPESRAIIDKERLAQLKKKEATARATKHAIDMAVSALNNAIFEHLLLNELETFLKKYEPAELEMRKRMEEAEAKSLEEHKIFSERPQKAESKALHIRAEQRGRYDYGGGRGFDYPGARAGYSPSYYGGPSDYSGRPSAPGARAGGGAGAKGRGAGGMGKAGEKPEEKKDAEGKEKTDQKLKAHEDKEKKGKELEPKDAKKEKEERELDPFAYKLGDLEQQLFAFNRNFHKDYFEKIATNKVKLEDLPRTLAQFSEATGLNDVADDLDYAQEKLKSAKDRKQKQYKTVLSGLDTRLKTFKENASLAHEALGKSAQNIRQLGQAAAQKQAGGKPEETPEETKEAPVYQEIGGMITDVAQTLQSAIKNAEHLSEAVEQAKKEQSIFGKTPEGEKAPGKRRVERWAPKPRQQPT